MKTMKVMVLLLAMLAISIGIIQSKNAAEQLPEPEPIFSTVIREDGFRYHIHRYEDAIILTVYEGDSLINEFWAGSNDHN